MGGMTLSSGGAACDRGAVRDRAASLDRMTRGSASARVQAAYELASVGVWARDVSEARCELAGRAVVAGCAASEPPGKSQHGGTVAVADDMDGCLGTTRISDARTGTGLISGSASPATIVPKAVVPAARITARSR